MWEAWLAVACYLHTYQLDCDKSNTKDGSLYKELSLGLKMIYKLNLYLTQQHFVMNTLILICIQDH